MRNKLIWAAVSAVMVLCGGLAGAATDQALAKMDGDLVLRFHFAGTDALAKDSRAASLNQIGALPATAILRDKTLDKLATAPYRFLKGKLAGPNASNFAPFIRPLLDDLLRDESYAEMRGATNSLPELMLAVRVGNNRAILWEANLQTVLMSWTHCPITQIHGDGFTGWELKKHHNPNVIRCLQAGDWILFGWGWNDVKMQSSFLQRIKMSKTPVVEPGPGWLDVLLNWPDLLTQHPIPTTLPLPTKLPKMHLTVEGRGEFVRPKLVMQFPQPLNLKLDAWRLPKDMPRRRFVSFTAARGIAKGLEAAPDLRASNLEPLPNQFCMWADWGVPFETCVVMPVANASDYLTRIGPQLMLLADTDLKKWGLSSKATWKDNTLRIGQMPLLTPYLKSVREAGGNFLMAGLFPSTIGTNGEAFPQALINELNSKPNLVYYDQEITQARLDQWHGLQQIYLMVQMKPLPGTDQPAQKWVQAAKVKLQDCGTEVSLTAPDELTLIRNGAIGLTGVEIESLAYWLDAPGFPLEAHYELGNQRPSAVQRKK